MPHQNKLALIMLLVISSFVGGMTSNWFLQKIASANTSSKVITARAFHIVNENGESMGAFGLDDNGLAGLYIKDKYTGKIVLFFQADTKGAMFALKDENGVTRTHLRYSKGFGPMLSFIRPDGKKPAIMIASPTHKIPTLAFFDRKGVGRMTLALKPDGSPAIGMLGPDKQSRLHIQAPEDRGPMITMHPGSDRPAVVLGLIHHRPVLTLYTRYRSGVVAGVNQSGEPVLGLMRNGQTTWAPAGAASPSTDQDLDRAVDDLLR